MGNLASHIERFVDGFANSSASFDVSNQDNLQEQVAPQQNNQPYYLLEEDNYFSAIVENPIIKATLRKIADQNYSASVEATLQVATLVTADSCPTLHRVLSDCCRILLISETPEVYITNRIRGINALSMEVKRKKFIFVSQQAAVRLSESEMRFLLGHELGHHQQGNLVCHTVNGLMNQWVKASDIFGPILMDIIEIPLKRWCRQSEFNADRAGFLCCRDMEGIERLFVRLGMIETSNAYHQYKEIGEDHPMLNTRFAHLQEYAKNLEIK